MGILPRSIPSQVNRNNQSSTQMIMLVGKTAERMKNEPLIMGAFHLRETVVRWRSCGVRQTCSEPYALPFHWCEFEPLFYTLSLSFAVWEKDIITSPWRGLKANLFTHPYETMDFHSNFHRGMKLDHGMIFFWGMENLWVEGDLWVFICCLDEFPWTLSNPQLNGFFLVKEKKLCFV